VVKVVAGFLFVSLMLPSVAPAASCPAMTKELARLRLEYHRHVNGSEAKSDGAGFDELAEILDKIIDVKAEMRKSNCKVPPRPKSFDKDK
jgi:hypothetical protein